MRNTIHVEVCLKKNNCDLDSREKVLTQPLLEYLKNQMVWFNRSISVENAEDLSEVETLFAEWSDGRQERFHLPDFANVMFHFYCASQRPAEMETLNGSGDSDAVPSFSHWLLPSKEFSSLWENLFYDNNINTKLLNYALSALDLSQRQVNSDVIACNRLLLLHGPSGTGKTSLCKALAQKLAIRIRRHFHHTHLLEINSHSLFSKWFSESGKLVMSLFEKIREITADPRNLVCVLIDEVESLAYARDGMSGQEPKDAMRVVNALLTQLDTIKQQPNVLILATSNLANTIDFAFLDRADIKQFIGPPSDIAAGRIIYSILQELMRIGIIIEEDLSSIIFNMESTNYELSGRTLRKLPFLAYAELSKSYNFSDGDKVSYPVFLDAMIKAAQELRNDQKPQVKNLK